MEVQASFFDSSGFIEEAEKSEFAFAELVFPSTSLLVQFGTTYNTHGPRGWAQTVGDNQEAASASVFHPEVQL